jgi:hypothetical protein
LLFFGGKNSSNFFHVIKLENKTLRFKDPSHMPEKKSKKKDTSTILSKDP